MAQDKPAPQTEIMAPRGRESAAVPAIVGTPATPVTPADPTPAMPADSPTGAERARPVEGFGVPGVSAVPAPLANAELAADPKALARARAEIAKLSPETLALLRTEVSTAIAEDPEAAERRILLDQIRKSPVMAERHPHVEERSRFLHGHKRFAGDSSSARYPSRKGDAPRAPDGPGDDARALPSGERPAARESRESRPRTR